MPTDSRLAIAAQFGSLAMLGPSPVAVKASRPRILVTPSGMVSLTVIWPALPMNCAALDRGTPTQAATKTTAANTFRPVTTFMGGYLGLVENTPPCPAPPTRWPRVRTNVSSRWIQGPQVVHESHARAHNSAPR